MAQGFRKGSKCEAFANFSTPPPLKIVNFMMSMVATAQKDEGWWYGEQNVVRGKEVVMMYTDISRAYLHAPSRGEKNMELARGLWTSDYPENG